MEWTGACLIKHAQLRENPNNNTMNSVGNKNTEYILKSPGRFNNFFWTTVLHWLDHWVIVHIRFIIVQWCVKVFVKAFGGNVVVYGNCSLVCPLASFFIYSLLLTVPNAELPMLEYA